MHIEVEVARLGKNRGRVLVCFCKEIELLRLYLVLAINHLAQFHVGIHAECVLHVVFGIEHTHRLDVKAFVAQSHFLQMAVVHVHVEMHIHGIGLHLSAQVGTQRHFLVVDAQVSTHDSILQLQVCIGVAQVYLSVVGFLQVKVHVSGGLLVEEVETFTLRLHLSTQIERFVERHKLIDIQVLGIHVDVVRVVVHAIVHLRIHIALLGLCHHVGNEFVVLDTHIATHLHVLWDVEGTARLLWHESLHETCIFQFGVEIGVYLHLLLVGRVGDTKISTHIHLVWHVGMEVLHVDLLQVSACACHYAHLFLWPCLAESFQVWLCKQTDVALAEMSADLCLKLPRLHTSPLAIWRGVGGEAWVVEGIHVHAIGELHIAFVGFQHELLHVELGGIHLHVSHCFVHHQSALLLETHLFHFHVQITRSAIAHLFNLQMCVGRVDVAGIESLHTFCQSVVVAQTGGVNSYVGKIVDFFS